MDAQDVQQQQQTIISLPAQEETKTSQTSQTLAERNSARATQALAEQNDARAQVGARLAAAISDNTVMDGMISVPYFDDERPLNNILSGEDIIPFRVMFEDNRMDAIQLLVKAYDFAARKHATQRRKDAQQTPYINHPIGTAYVATALGHVDDPITLAACVLHDTVEDTDATHDELVREFGAEVAGVVREVTDDKTLRKDERKRAQIEHAKTMSFCAKTVKLCDKYYNLRDLISNVPPGYTVERVQGYCLWSRLVVAGLRGANPKLEALLDATVFDATFEFNGVTYPCCPADLSDSFVFPTE